MIMAEQPKSGIASLADRAKNMFRRVVEYPDPSVVMADQATADIPETFKDPRTYIEAEKGAVAGTLGLLGDVGSMSEGVADYIPYMPTFLRHLYRPYGSCRLRRMLKNLVSKKGC